MPANYNLRCRWDQTFRLPRDFSPYDTQLQAGAVARMEMTFANGFVLEFSSNSGDGKDGTFVYDSYKKGWFICPLNKLAALYLTFGGSSKALSATWAARLEKDGASQIVMSGRAIWSAPDITETGDSSSTGTGTGTFGQTVFVDGETDGVTPPLPVDFSTAVAMATQLAQDWATKTSAEVVAGQGYGAKKYAIDALASLTSAQAIAAGLSASTYTLDGIDAQRVGALFSAPKGLFMLNGAQVARSSLLSFSSAAKYTVGPDGNYILNSVNSPAWDWSTGRRRLLIEAIGATNYWRNSENGAAWTIVAATPTVVSNALFGVLSLTTLTADSTSWARAQETKSVNAGDIVTFSGAAVAGNKTTATIYIAGSVSGNGLASQVVPTVKSGPGTIAADTTFGSIRMWRVNGLSASVPTEFAFTMTCPSTETITVQIGVGVYTGGASGDSAKFGRLQLEPGYGSSYTPCGASPTARAADVVTAASGLLALLTAENAAFVMRGQVLTPVISYSRLLSGNSGAVLISARSSDPAVATIGYIQQGANAPSVSAGAGNMLTGFGICGAINGSQAKLAFNGGAVSTTLDSFAGVLSSVGLFGAGTGYPVNGFLDELVEWPIFASDAGLQAQARVYS